MEVHRFLSNSAGSFTETAPRPPVPGEENELQSNGGMSTRSSGSHKSQLSGRSHTSSKSARSDVSLSATPRRSNLDKIVITASSVRADPKLDCGGDVDAPLGFEPEGSATNSPPFTEASTNSTPPYFRWAQNLKYLLDDSDGVVIFKQFLDQEQCANVLDFWFACNGLKIVDAGDAKRIQSLSRLIYKKYIKGDQLKLSHDAKHAIAEKLKRGYVDQTLFDQAQTEVENSMRTNMYPLFLKSDIYLQYIQNGGESPKTSNNSSGSSSARPLPTLHEDVELRQEDIKKSLTSMLALTPQSLMVTRRSRESMSFKKPEGIYPVPNRRVPNPYHVSYAPVSTQDSELQSLSSDALTDDTMSLTDSSIDGRGEIPYGSKKWKKHKQVVRRNADLNRRTGLNQPLIPRTDRAPKDRNLAETEPKKFAMMLIERLQKVKEDIDKMMRVEHSINAIELTESESESSVSCAPTNKSVPTVGAVPLGTLIATAMDDREENAQSILEDHVSRIWDSSTGQTPSRSPGRHSPQHGFLRLPSYIAGPSPNVSGNLSYVAPVPPTLPPKSYHHKRKEKDLNTSNHFMSALSFNSSVGDVDRSASGVGAASSAVDTSLDSHSRHVHHYHHHHHVNRAENRSRHQREQDVQSSGSAAYFRSVPPPVAPSNVSDRHSASMLVWEDINRQHTRDSKRATAKKLSISSNIDSGIGMLYDAGGSLQMPNLKDPASEKVLAWMSENEHVAATTQYSTDNSDKGSSHRRSHKSNGSSKKTSQYNATRSSSQDRGATLHQSFVQPGDYNYPYGTVVQPCHPFVQDPSMPLLNPPNPTVQLEEARRRLEDEAKPAMSRSFTGSLSSKERRSMQAPGARSMQPPAPRSMQSSGNRSMSSSRNIPQQSAPLDLSSSEEHSSGSVTSGKRQTKKSSADVTVVGYYFCGEPIPYRITVPGKRVTLAQFKQLITKRGSYRYYFKKACDEFDSGVVHEEIIDDSAVLPMWEGKVVGKVDRVE